MKPGRTLAAAVASLGLVATAVAAAPAATAAPVLTAEVAAAAPTAEEVFGHLEAFSSIAAANDGNRALGTSGYEASGAYVEQQLRSAGYSPVRQYFDVEEADVTTSLTTSPTVTPAPVSVPFDFTPDTPAGGVTGDLVQPVDAGKLGCDAAAWAGVDLTGDIALVSRGTCTFSAKSLAARAAGAAAVIIYNNSPVPFTGTLGTDLDGHAPTTGITALEGAALVAALADGPVSATLAITTTITTTETFNVIAETATGRDDNVVMIGAHLDSVPEGAGINDNGSGSAAILETALDLAAAGPLNNKVRFAWWGAEEVGLLGSTHYVDDLVENDPSALDDIATYLNFDMVGSPNYIIGVYDADESTFPAPVEVPEGSIATEDVFTDYFDGIDQPWVDTEFSGRSDYQAFIVNGIPASGLFTGADDVKTPVEVALFGGTAGITHDPNYHSAEDDLSNVDTTALGIMTGAIWAATTSLAADTSAVNGVQPPKTGVVVTDVRASALCINKQAVVVVAGTNGEASKIDLTLTVPFGTQTAKGIKPGETRPVFVSSRGKKIAAGTATFTGTAVIDGKRLSQSYEVSYPAKSC